MGLKRGIEQAVGYLSPYMITDAERMEAVLDDPYIPETGPARACATGCT
jgi:hypothetical protein